LIEIKGRAIITTRPLLIRAGMFLLEPQIFISPSGDLISEYDNKKSVFLDKGVKLINVCIDAPTYISKNAKLQYSNLSQSNRTNFIGKDSVISHVTEFYGSFVSDRCYIHANDINNFIVGSDSGFAVGTHSHNHPQKHLHGMTFNTSEKRPHKYEKKGNKIKLPTIVGRNVKVGANCMIHSGSIFQKNSIANDGWRIEGAVEIQNGKTVHIPYRSEHKLNPEYEVKYMEFFYETFD